CARGGYAGNYYAMDYW
nr:immunoglobulin heavy chain junction region [Mus musculus]NSM04537.1 immunoglobulin heavy chain junction region [Mus musculus]NSM07223.1 immunoglobulin heavy chain junction region [Mus musculus]NSM08514.1 immunoglobulin heavy chain junction region [Mus musculus]NSM09371.1 immunoglobulin heavy chain junction region [Mus musculus]